MSSSKILLVIVTSENRKRLPGQVLVTINTLQNRERERELEGKSLTNSIVSYLQPSVKKMKSFLYRAQQSWNVAM